MTDESAAFARNSDPDSSHLAAESLNVSYMEDLVLQAISRFPGGCIADDVERELHFMRLVSISPRFRPLMTRGLVVDTGERRKARSGRTQRVMKATTAGLEHVKRKPEPLT